MAQFVLVFLHSLQTLYFECNYPKVVAKVTSPTLDTYRPKMSSYFSGNDYQHGHLLYPLRELLFLRLHHKEEGQPKVDNSKTARRLRRKW